MTTKMRNRIIVSLVSVIVIAVAYLLLAYVIHQSKDVALKKERDEILSKVKLMIKGCNYNQFINKKLRENNQ